MSTPDTNHITAAEATAEALDEAAALRAEHAAMILARDAETPEQRAHRKAMAAKLFQADDNYFGADTLTPQQAELARLRDSLADAGALIAAQQTRIEELSCEVLSLKGAVLA